MSSKREREYEQRRYEKWQQRQAEHRAARRRQRIVAGSVLGGLLLVIAIVAVVGATKDDDTPTAFATDTPPASASAEPTASGEPTASPGPSATRDPLTPDPALAEARTWTGSLDLSQGDIGISLDGAAAPQAVANFVTLADKGFFDGTKCHRLTTSGIYVLQCGSPDGTGTDGPGYSWGPIENAPADGVYPAGTIAMARVGNDGSSMGSQFFLVYKDSTIPADAAGGYTVFGHITSGQDVLTAIADAGTTEGTESPVHDVIIEGVKVK
ncbi:peptidylprolyl isomerase [Cellulomonas edaphi]|uniref:peptidylprolyl isomerase n=1 Tax=Cellulomonas edaphi TaxID=3053468 RepID=A0ABT7S6L5_9CELL|nr:peptidylprolyl isomerase [Cellulomons edaphi]MDM7831263.1 peptidylprolyl isomerase [Cellulomons edaphi]